VDGRGLAWPTRFFAYNKFVDLALLRLGGSLEIGKIFMVCKRSTCLAMGTRRPSRVALVLRCESKGGCLCFCYMRWLFASFVVCAIFLAMFHS
jgi:hypothetical protein